jgi:hypothetical protein
VSLPIRLEWAAKEATPEALFDLFRDWQRVLKNDKSPIAMGVFVDR